MLIFSGNQVAGAWLSGACLSLFIALVENRNVLVQMLLVLCLNRSGLCDCHFLPCIFFCMRLRWGGSNSAVVNIALRLTMWAVLLAC